MQLLLRICNAICRGDIEAKEMRSQTTATAEEEHDTLTRGRILVRRI